MLYTYIYTYILWRFPNGAPCFGCKGSSALQNKNRGHWGSKYIYIYKCGGLFSQETQAPKTAWNILVTWIIKSSDMSGKILAQFPLYSWVCHSLFGLAFTGGAMWIMENFPSTGLTSQQLLDCTNLFQSQLLSCSFLLTSGGYDSILFLHLVWTNVLASCSKAAMMS